MRTDYSAGLLIAGLSMVSACDRSGTELLPPANDAFPSVVEYGEVQVLSSSEFGEFKSSGDPWAWCAEEDEAGRPRCVFGQVSTPPAGVKGGATFNFQGTGGWVCLITDPETVFWSKSIAVAGKNDRYIYPDLYSDDGDIDLFAGLSSYYTGSPGVELGDFKGFYTDSLGRQIEIEYGECTQQGAQTGQNDAHAGRGAPEYCGINTDERDGIGYTALLQTFSVPLDDGVLSFGALVVGSSCNSLGITECTILGEGLDTSGKLRDCSDALEVAYCENQLTEFCCANPGMCGEAPPDDACDDVNLDEFCGENPALCCGD